MTAKLSYFHLVKRGLFDENTIFRMAISLCPAIAVTSTVRNAFLMGIAVLFVQTAVNVSISCIRSIVHPRIRLPLFMLTTAAWVSIVDLLMAAFIPAAYAELGLYIQLIVAFASILAGAEMFASKNDPISSFFDGIGRGSGFLLALLVIGAVRELIGKGALLDFSIFPRSPMLVLILPAGGFLTVGLLMGFFNWLSDKNRTAQK